MPWHIQLYPHRSFPPSKKFLYLDTHEFMKYITLLALVRVELYKLFFGGVYVKSAKTRYKNKHAIKS